MLPSNELVRDNNERNTPTKFCKGSAKPDHQFLNIAVTGGLIPSLAPDHQASVLQRCRPHALVPDHQFLNIAVTDNNNNNNVLHLYSANFNSLLISAAQQYTIQNTIHIYNTI